MIISVVSQKGGVGKSSISRTLAVEFTRAGWKTLLADIDTSQITSNRWAEKRRNNAGIEPKINTAVYSVVAQALAEIEDFDLIIIDGAPHATRGTIEAAKSSDLIIIPTGSSMDDLEPSILLANELANSLNSKYIYFLLYKTTSEPQAREARETLCKYGYNVLIGDIPVKTGYIDAFDRGYCATETRYQNLNDSAKNMVESIATKLQEKK